MGKSTPKQPAAPDPNVVNTAQTQSNKDTALYNAQLNRINQYTPYGSLTYTQTGGGKQYNMDAYNKALQAYAQGAGKPAATPMGGTMASQATRGQRQEGASTGNTVNTIAPPKLEDFLISDSAPQFRSDVKLSDTQQKIFDQQQQQDLAINDVASGYIGRIGNVMGKDYNYDGLSQKAPVVDDAYRQQIQDALMSRMNPSLNDARQQREAALANQGITWGSEAYDQAQRQLGQNENDARLASILAGGQEAQRDFTAQMAARQQQIQEYDRARNAPLNEFNSLRSASQIQMPSFTPVPAATAPGTDISAAYNAKYAGEMSNYNADVAANNSTMGALFGLGGALGSSYLYGLGGSKSSFNPVAFSNGLPWSDIRLKKDLKRIGTTPGGVGVYEFKYIWDDEPQTGVIAQEVEKVAPEAVIASDNGFKRVDYAMVP